MNQLFDRMLRAAKLDSMLYEEVEHDPTATGQAMAVVLLSSMAAGIGSPLGGGLGAMAVYAVIALVSWLIWSGVLRVVGFIPLLGWLVGLLAAVWMLVAMVIAVRQALDYRGTGRAIVVCLIGWVVMMVISPLVGGLILHS